jgi:hypothetical protein
MVADTVKVPPPFLEVSKDGHLTRTFHDGQRRAYQSKAQVVALLGGSQSGKTVFGGHWMWQELYGGPGFTGRGPGDYLAVTATYPLLRLKMLPEFLYLFQTLLHLGTWKEGEKVFVSHDRHHGAEYFRVIFASATNPESIESATALAAWLDECGQDQFKLEAWEAVERRLSLAQGRILCTTTPYNLGWFKQKVYDPWKAGDKRFDVIQVDSIVNPTFPPEEYARARASLPRWKFNLFYRGLFDKPAGLIYDCFDEDTCIIQRFNIPKEWPRYVGHDFGPNNTAAVWYAQDPGTGYLYVYRTYRDGGLSAFDHAQKFKEASQGENILRRVGGAQHEDGWRESFTAAGWPITKPREREVEIGINRVYGWHSTNKIFVFKDMVEYLDEKLSYSRKLDDRFEPTKDIQDKSRFHLMDAERYVISDFQPEAVMGQKSRVHLIRA